MRNDPLMGFRFMVEIDQLFEAGFSEVSGLQAETEVEEYWEGGTNDFVRKFPKATRYGNLVLKRGLTGSKVLWQWYKNVVEGTIVRKNGTITLFDQAGEEKWRWNFYNAYPVKWTGPDFKADGNSVAFESIELVHEGIVKG